LAMLVPAVMVAATAAEAATATRTLVEARVAEKMVAAELGTRTAN
jgi:hypothetical protein